MGETMPKADAVADAVDAESRAWQIVRDLRKWRDANGYDYSAAPSGVFHIHIGGRLYLSVTNGVSAVAIAADSEHMTSPAPKAVTDVMESTPGEPTWFDLDLFREWAGRGNFANPCPNCRRRPGVVYGAIYNLSVIASVLNAVRNHSDGDAEVAWLPVPGNRYEAVRIEPEHRDWIVVLLPMNRGSVNVPRFAPEWPRDLRLLEAA